ncbi:SusD/RagB family nutrient-binding outer membrane lipoprotein [Chryseobacterium indologenes]|uniref:SusD/RagB family nutrient-binding outer membrane lipoprotein n=1 Tax=Chryseobacterium indologenes TaxID=253 RepID=UPI000BFEA079|nr:SusD/RagB family nutrient-binding outer membrane lipoprotein [Chryseobacterium indologenes]ATN06557.1 SusD/RagB family nutrient-binding outer membrane lipoprotein [Chryseobacterium indologenes]AYY84683.1 SusD/RagB family nutrient-binding outer membrane lipoprotein [Chryseobacterium indologenes]QIX81567.1 SusD/RagB family nutrient-binding outer membrane lipoprotein [Chryseobacterium indologenes]UDQ55324.1 SusD/RagB family nutrient-binding outer membrane lipoprotein [Chryseobacterium indologen
MKNIIKISLVSACIGLALSSCQSDLTSLNDDPKHPSVLPSDNLLATALYQSSYYMDNPSVNFNNYRFFTQQWAETQYPDETQYNLVTRNQPRGHFNRMYVYSINNLKQAKTNLKNEVETDDIRANKMATLEIEEIFIWENIVDTFGDVPYSEAFRSDEILTPKYDDAKTIYLDLIKRIDAVTATIKPAASGYSDLVYGGNMTKWKKFANSIKLRLGMNLADVDPALAKTTVESAIAGGVISSDDEAYKFKYDGGTFSNPVFDNLVASNRNDFVPSELTIKTMSALSDPRMDVWFTKVGGVYKGGVFGELNDPYTNYSQLSSYFRSATAPSNLLSYAEVAFLKAEAAARGFAAGGTAVDLYAAAVAESMRENGVSAANAATYIAANPLNIANWKQSIGTQAWIAMFNKGFASWNFTRRLDYPILVNPPKSNLSSVPYRMPYSDQEYVLNGANVKAAGDKIGGDKATTKLFWDKN